MTQINPKPVIPLNATPTQFIAQTLENNEKQREKYAQIITDTLKEIPVGYIHYSNHTPENLPKMVEELVEAYRVKHNMEDILDDVFDHIPEKSGDALAYSVLESYHLLVEENITIIRENELYKEALEKISISRKGKKKIARQALQALQALEALEALES